MLSAEKHLVTVLICHAEEPLHHEGVARWLAHHSNLRGIVVIHDSPKIRHSRIRRELNRSGLLSSLDVLLFRAFYFIRFGRRDLAWREATLETLKTRYAPLEPHLPIIDVTSPNNRETEDFIRHAAPDLALVLCKHILRPAIFTLPRFGTFVLHPGICPEYRNAHGCFWAMVHDDYERVGMTLLQVDAGVDTGPVFGYFTCPFDQRVESPIVIQHRVTLENLEAVWERLEAVTAGKALPISTEGRQSQVWGHPRLTSYVAWRWRCRKESNASHRS